VGRWEKSCVTFDFSHRQTLWRWLDRAVNEDLLKQSGAGRKFATFVYWLPCNEERWATNPRQSTDMAHWDEREALKRLNLLVRKGFGGKGAQRSERSANQDLRRVEGVSEPRAVSAHRTGRSWDTALPKRIASQLRSPFFSSRLIFNLLKSSFFRTSMQPGNYPVCPLMSRADRQT